MLTNFELPPKKFELGDKVRHVYVDDSIDGKTETYIVDCQIIGYQFQDKLWMDGGDGIYLNSLGWVYAAIWEEKSHAEEETTYIAFSHFMESELDKINSSEPQPILNFSALKGKLAFGDVRRNSEGVIEVIR